MSAAADGLSEWRVTRRAILARDRYACVECGTACRSSDGDVHHLLPKSVGGTDEPSNLVTLCDGCHAAHHPKLSGSLARRAMERWGIRLARWLDRYMVDASAQSFGPALRLFGLDRFRDGQLPIVLAALQGRSVLVVSPTGFGKTLCFQLPAVLRPGLSVVVSPLKALMAEQVSSLLRRKIPSTFINSDLDAKEKRTRYELLTRQTFKLLYAAPERFFVQSRSERERVEALRPAFLVVDEAHCVDQWGGRLQTGVRAVERCSKVIWLATGACVHCNRRTRDAAADPEITRYRGCSDLCSRRRSTQYIAAALERAALKPR